jgi:pimeloyl-ACP methyl ester carboxylesterase
VANGQNNESRKLHAAIGIGVVVIFTVLLALIAPQSPIVDVAAADPDIAAPSDTAVTITPEIPDFYNVTNTNPAAPGTLVKSEPIPGGPANTKNFRFIYHSTDNDGKDQLVSGMYTEPTGTPPPGGFPLVTYAHGTTGSNQHCGISLTPFQANTPGFSNYSRQIMPLVQAGNAVVSTDYQGMGAPGTPMYLVGQVEGANVLDAVRAAHSPEAATQWQTNINKDQTVIWGHSQGGHSSSFAAQMAPTYAPEINISGAAVLSPGLLPTLPLAVETLASGTEPSGMTGFVMLIATSWSATYPDRIKPEDILTPAGVAKLSIVNSLCGEQESDAFMDGGMSKYVRQDIPAEFYSLMAENTPGLVPIKMPIVMVQGMKDTTIIPQLTLAFDKQLCLAGNTVDFHIYPNDTHPGVVVNSSQMINQWIADRFAGKPAPNNCSNQ